MSTKSCSDGVVVGVERGLVRVRVSAEGDTCAACSVAALCGKGDVIEVAYPDAERLKVGARVRVVFPRGEMPLWASVLMPAVILIGVAVCLLGLGLDDIWCVAGAVGALAGWYAATHYIYNKVAVRVEPLDPSERFSGSEPLDD